MEKGTTPVEENVSPNLIPMIDIMFLLLLFFMLGADMGQHELEKVSLPRASSIVPDEAREKNERLTINVHHREEVGCTAYARKQVCRDESHWRLVIRGADCTDSAALNRAVGQEAARFPSTAPDGRKISDRRVMIRADATAPYALAQRAMNACAAGGIYKVEVGAARPPQEPRKG